MTLRNFSAILSILLTACTTTIVPLRSSLNTIEAKIENPEKGKIYKLHSTSHRDNEIVGIPQNVDGLLHFDISRSTQEISKCYAFYDGKNYIPIKDKLIKFSNPAIKTYVKILNDFNIENANIKKNETLLISSAAYRSGQCVLLSEKDMPEKPSSACAPYDEESFSQLRCRNNTSYPTFTTALQNIGLCTATGLVAGGVTANPWLGIAAGGVCKLLTSNYEEENQYNLCIGNSRNDCRKTYNEWANKKSYLLINSDKLYQECDEIQEVIKNSILITNNIKVELNRAAQSWTSITENDYCP